MEFQEVMRHRFAEVIEAATGRLVIGFMSGNQQHPDLMCEVFILGPTDLVDEDEIPVFGRRSAPALNRPRLHLRSIGAMLAGGGHYCGRSQTDGHQNLTSGVLFKREEVHMLQILARYGLNSGKQPRRAAIPV